MQVEELLDVAPFRGSDPAPLLAPVCLRCQESADGGAHVAIARPPGESVQMFARCIGGTRAEDLLCVVQHGCAEERRERRGRKRLLSSREEGTEIGKERRKLVLDIVYVESGRMKEPLRYNVAYLRETESKTVFENRDSGLCGVATIIRWVVGRQVHDRGPLL